MLTPSFTEAPFVRALLRTLLFAASIEAIFYRLLTIPPTSSWGWVEELHVSTARGGVLMFMVAFALLLPTLLTIAYSTLRAPAWPGGLNALVAMGILALLALGISAGLSPRGPAFALAFSVLAASVALAMLAGMYDARQDLAGRFFAVSLSGAIVCMAASGAVDLAARILPGRFAFPTAAVAAAGRWLFITSGLAAFPAFASETNASLGAAGRAAGLGLSVASAFTLVVGAVAHPPLLSRVGGALGIASTDSMGSIPDILRTSAAAAALFLTTQTALRIFPAVEGPGRAYGLLFILLAGYPHRIAYQHLLALTGVALVTGSARPRPPYLPVFPVETVAPPLATDA